MKGLHNNIKFSQFIYCDQQILQKLLAFENFQDNLKQTDNFLEYKFSTQSYFNMEMLLTSLNYNYIKLNIGTILIILRDILLHLNQLHKLQICHGQLLPEYIIIKLKSNSKQITVYEQPINIEKVHFINYKLLEQQYEELENYESLFISWLKEEIQQIKNIMKQMLSFQFCQATFWIQDLLNEINEPNDLEYCITLLNNLILQFIDNETQKIKQNQNDQEGFFQKILSEGKKFIEQRNRIANYYEKILEQYSFCQQFIKNKELQEPYNDNQDHHQYFEIFEWNITYLLIKHIWSILGQQLDDSIVDEQYVNQINEQQKILLESVQFFFLNLDCILQKVQNLANIYETKIKEQYKFSLSGNDGNIIAKQLFIQQLKCISYKTDITKSSYAQLESQIQFQIQAEYKNRLCLKLIEFQLDLY